MITSAIPQPVTEGFPNDANHGPFNDLPDLSKEETTTAEVGSPATAEPPEPYSVLTPRQKQIAIFIVSFVAMISPLAGNIYYPAIPILATDFGVSASLIQLTITAYQIFQGIAPTFIASFSDSYGRRPAYAICLVIFLAANIGLALNTSYAGLVVLRCVQSTGSAATVSLGAGAVADLVTRAERGRFISYAALGVTLGPVLAPIIGGLLTEYLGWQSIFWFLTIYAGLIFTIYCVLVPETARSVVGNGSIAPKRFFMTPLQLLKLRREPAVASEQSTHQSQKRKPLNPFASTFRILAEAQGAVVVWYGALVYGGFFMVLTTFPIQLSERFGLNAAQTGLCFLPIFVGTICSRWVAGRLLDRNYRRLAKRHGIEISPHRDKSHLDEAIPIEAARLQICIPMIYLNGVCVLAYGWAMQSGQAPLAGVEVCLFFLGIFNSGGLVGLGTLIMDLNQESPATAAAANNMVRYLVSAGATAAAMPLIDRIGIGWTSVFIVGVWVCFSPFLWLVLFKGDEWRRKKKTKQKGEDGAVRETQHQATEGQKPNDSSLKV
ncbi:Major facilitator superfamily domain containing protein [Rhypophila sp. PSN 637]